MKHEFALDPAKEQIHFLFETPLAQVRLFIQFLPLENAVTKQLNDKERVAAALENPNLVEMVDECLSPSFE